MKKRILSILLTLCMVLMLVSATAFADENYMITQNFKYGTRTYDGTDPHESPYQFVIPAGGSFTLATIEDCSPYELVGWKENGSGTVYAPYTDIENLQSDLTFDAVYQVQGGLAITVDGFMPGKTPNDCTYSVESTIPGVTFSADDILSADWQSFIFNGADYSWRPASNSTAFQADTPYRLMISLNNNGLELVPSTTVNGIVPYYSKVLHNDGVPHALEIECELGTPAEPTLAVTVDNFEVGKKLSECTFSFETTNLDVTFSESDILGVYWESYDRYAESFYQVDDSNVFQTGVPSYRCTIELDSKGLTVAPAATVNGNTPESCEIVTSGGKTVLRITCELGTPLAQQLTISGMSVVCKDQDYEFSVTAAEGAEALHFLYRCGEFGGDTGWDRTDGGVCYGTVPASDYRDADTLELTVYGTAANGKPATATKTVQILKEHRFVDGVCACGAKPEYTVEYIGSADDPICMEVKTHGKDLTLRGETFTKDGYVQTGWIDKETGAVYALGDTYTEDADVTLNPVFEKIITLTVPYTTTVALGDVGVPGEKAFTLALIGDSAPDKDKSNVTVSGSVTTNGKGSYNGTLTITGPEQTLWYMLSEGAFVQQVDDGEAGWTVDDTVWGVLMEEIPVAYATSDDAVASKYTVYAVPASIDGNGDYTIDWDNLQSADMTFTNTYTAHVYELNHDADGHWDECTGCGDIQNEEAHKYGDWTVTKEATEKEAGEKEHTCTVCGYTETAEIEKLAATTDLTKPGSTSPQTGDNRHMALWFALLFVSGAGVIGTTVYGKKKRAK
ncbi:MAG: hypothetical protein PUC62_05845 [Oscillospiraceae bacterium]|nr:hypothetical protein [Oscillospiraceae bacterium]